MCFIVFALSPCTIKDILNDVAYTEFARSFNKSKTTTSGNSCTYGQNAYQLASATEIKKINEKKEPGYFQRSKTFISFSFHNSKGNPKAFSGTSPPKYILYRCLKIDLA